MGRITSRAGVACYACALLTLLALAVGIAIAVELGVASGMEIGRLDRVALARVTPLLIVAELLKIATAVAVAVVVLEFRGHPARTARTWLGLLAAALVGAAGLLGLFALSSSGPASAGLGRIVGLLGLASVPMTGIWVIMLATTKDQAGAPFPTWLRAVALSLLALGLAAPIFPPVGILFGLVSLAWWVGLGRYAERMSSSE